MKKLIIGTSLSVAMFLSTNAFGQTLYSEEFNTDVTASWTVNNSFFTDNTADFFFDYSLSGVPEAPNSEIGDSATRGLQLRVNEFGGLFGGFSVSPTGLDLGTGDYVMTFDLWENSIGPFPGGGSGSTQFGQYGILTSGTSTAEAGESSVDGVFFAATGDGGSSADWRAYSSDKNFSYQEGDQLGGINVYNSPLIGDDTNGCGQRNACNSHYAAFGSVAAPVAQQALFPGTQDTTLIQAGSAAFVWYEVSITKIGNVVTWNVNGLDIARIDTTDFVIPTGGNNILFGRGDVNATSSSDPNEALLLFTLIDNIKVEVASASIPGDLDDDGYVGITDLNIVLGNWDETIPPGDERADPSGDDFVGIEDLNIVLANWDSGTPPASVVPEPTTLALLSLGGLAMLRRRR